MHFFLLINFEYIQYIKKNLVSLIFMHQVESYSNGHSLNGKFAYDIFGFIKRILFYLRKLMHVTVFSLAWRNLHDSRFLKPTW